MSIATLVKCVNDKDESVLRMARKGAEEIKENRAFHGLHSKAWVVTKVFCYDGSKGGEESGEFADESGKNVFVFAQIWVTPPAEESTSKVVSLVKACAD